MKLTYNPRIIRHLGYELITSDEIAITELIKNSYDARASKINIQFLSSIEKLDKTKIDNPIPDIVLEKINSLDTRGVIFLEDNGKGMTYDILKTGFFEVGTKLKKDEKVLEEEGDDSIILGDKGIGRLAAQRIAPVLIVETAVANSNEINVILVTWKDYVNIKDFDAPEWKITQQVSNPYTRLWLLGNSEQPVLVEKYYQEQEDFEIEDLFGNPGRSLGVSLYAKSELQSALSFLYSPFEAKKSAINLNLSTDDSKIIKLDFNYQALQVAESIHSFSTENVFDDKGNVTDLKVSLKMEIRPWFLERIHHRELGSVLYQDWKREPSEYKQLYEKYKEHYVANLEEIFLLSSVLGKWKKKHEGIFPEGFLGAILNIVPIQGKIYTFKRDNTLMSMARRSAVDNNYIDPNTRVNYDIRPFLESNNGIKLYRNSYRLATIGNKDNDWLELQQKRTSGQQFYRFELGNVIGFININDKKQDYIYETSSREHLTKNIHSDSLQIFLSEVLDIFSPGYTKTAVELTKRFLDLEGWIPENNDEEIENELNKSKEILEAAKQNLKAIKEAINAIKDNIALDSEEKINSVKKVFEKLQPVAFDFEQNIDDTQRSFKSANQLLEVARQEQARIKTEAYNNYKLMANGLVTEIITHELHSLLNSSEEEAKKYEAHFKAVEDFLLYKEEYVLNKDHFLPIKNKFEHLYKRMGDMDKLYSFLEKTFITRDGNRALLSTNVNEELAIISDRFKFRLNRHNITIDTSLTTNSWEVPKGALLHVFYNLIDNSIYWIKERQKLSRTNVKYSREGKDQIVIKTVSNSAIQFSDTGIGVYDKYQHILFNELVSGKEGGRGMGLYIVRQFLKSFGGEIELLPILNEYGNRYIFEIRLNYLVEENEQA